MRGSLIGLALASAAHAAPAVPANGAFVSQNYAITFRSEPGLTYCPLADDWTGSDHGTVLFLVPPTDCGGAGYSSSGRGFAPEMTPRIEVYYGNWDADLPARPCVRVGRIVFLGRARSLCRTQRDTMTGFVVSGQYPAYGRAEAVLTLVTTPDRLSRDIGTFRALAETVHACTLAWRDAAGRARIAGSGRRCAASGDFY